MTDRTRAASPGSGGGPDIEVAPGGIGGRLDSALLFGRSSPLEIEIGIGKGRFLLQQAGERPDVDFLGLEWSLKHLRVAKERAAARRLSNVRLLRVDARHVIADLMADGSVQRLHVYCPDPWPKKRHHKRRFFSPATAPHLERVLVAGGFLHLSTDVREYFEVIREVLREHTGLRESSDALFPIDDAGGKTNYEVKYLAAGRPIFRATYRKEGGAR